MATVSTLRPQALLFDWDNTLVSSWKLHYEAFNYTLRAFSQPSITLTAFQNQPHASVRNLFLPILQARAPQAEEIFYTYLKKRHLHDLQPLPGALDLLKWAHQQGIFMALVSNKFGDIVRREVRHLDWQHYFLKIVGSYDTAEDKPAPIPLWAALEGSQLTPNPSIWFVGDSFIDVMAAHAAGYTPVAVGPGASQQKEIPVLQGKDCHFLKALLRRL